MAKVLHTFTIKRSAEIEEEKTETVKDEKGEDKVRTYKETVTKEIPVEIKLNTFESDFDFFSAFIQ